MTPEQLDEILSTEPSIAPSPMFAVAVMTAVRQEAALPPPLPFPWRRLWVGAALLIGTAAVLAVAPTAAARGAAMLGPLLAQAAALQLHWVALAALVSLLLAWSGRHVAEALN